MRPIATGEARPAASTAAGWFRSRTQRPGSRASPGPPRPSSVTPGRAGRDVYGVPVYDSVRDVIAKHGPVQGSVISVPPAFVRDACFEAIECASLFELNAYPVKCR